MVLTVQCPTCQKAVLWLPENEYRPFCCARCRLIDLGQWADEQFTLPQERQESELDE
jgi:endogenous inhibitor of DNA gyrase (YacG/DUF329 family)